MVRRCQRAVVSDVLSLSKRHHPLVMPKAAQRRHHLRPRESDLDLAAARAGVDWVEACRLPDDGAALCAVDSRRGQP